MRERLTSKEAADILQVEESLLLKWIQGGRLRGEKVGSGWRVLEEDLNEFLSRGPKTGRGRVLQWIDNHFTNVQTEEYPDALHGVMVRDREGGMEMLVYWSKEEKRVKCTRRFRRK